jgi:hypothetical protein
MELDLCPLPYTESAAAIIDGNIGELTRFHETFRIYAHAVAPETAKLQRDFRDRLIKMDVGGVRVHCLAPIDLAYSKLAAGREKGFEFVVGLLHHKIVRPSESLPVQMLKLGNTSYRDVSLRCVLMVIRPTGPLLNSKSLFPLYYPPKTARRQNC